jgi:hypothetical protein
MKRLALAGLVALCLGTGARADQPRIMAPNALHGTGSAAGAPAWTNAPVPGDGDIALPVTYTDGRITVRAERGLDDVVPSLAQRADAALTDAATDLADLAVPAHVEVRLVRDSRDLARAAPPGHGAPPWAAGVAYPHEGVVVVALGRSGAPIDVLGTTAHEMAHLALGAALGDHVPRWLHEGFAWQHSPTDEDSGRLSTLVGMTWFGSTIPLDELEAGFPAEELPASRAYAESYELVQFLAERGRWEDRSDHGDREPFRRFLRDLAHGQDLDTAASHAFGRPMRVLFDEWEADLKNRYLWIPVELFGMLLWVVAAILLVLAWRRRRRQRRITLEIWERQEAAARAARVELDPDLDALENAPDDDEPREPYLN